MSVPLVPSQHNIVARHSCHISTAQYVATQYCHFRTMASAQANASFLDQVWTIYRCTVYHCIFIIIMIMTDRVCKCKCMENTGLSHCTVYTIALCNTEDHSWHKSILSAQNDRPKILRGQLSATHFSQYNIMNAV